MKRRNDLATRQEVHRSGWNGTEMVSYAHSLTGGPDFQARPRDPTGMPIALRLEPPGPARNADRNHPQTSSVTLSSQPLRERGDVWYH
jgi:hypothetical protein